MRTAKLDFGADDVHGPRTPARCAASSATCNNRAVRLATTSSDSTAGSSPHDMLQSRWILVYPASQMAPPRAPRRYALRHRRIHAAIGYLRWLTEHDPSRGNSVLVGDAEHEVTKSAGRRPVYPPNWSTWLDVASMEHIAAVGGGLLDRGRDHGRVRRVTYRIGAHRRHRLQARRWSRRSSVLNPNDRLSSNMFERVLVIALGVLLWLRSWRQRATQATTVSLIAYAVARNGWGSRPTDRTERIADSLHVSQVECGADVDLADARVHRGAELSVGNARRAVQDKGVSRRVTRCHRSGRGRVRAARVVIAWVLPTATASPSTPVVP